MRCFVVMLLCGCSTTAVHYKRPYRLMDTTSIVVLGFDFTQCQFWDQHFEPESIINTDLIRWNREVSAFTAEQLARWYVSSVATELTGQRNKQVVAKQFQVVPPIESANLQDESLKTVVAPYLQTSGDADLGLLFVVDQLNKNTKRVHAHFVLVDIRSQRILLYHQARGGLVRGSLSRVYRKPLEEIARIAIKTIRKHAL